MLALNLKGYEQAVLRLNSSIKGQPKTFQSQPMELSGLGAPYVNRVGSWLPDAARWAAPSLISIAHLLLAPKRYISTHSHECFLASNPGLTATIFRHWFFNGSMKDF